MSTLIHTPAVRRPFTTMKAATRQAGVAARGEPAFFPAIPGIVLLPNRQSSCLVCESLRVRPTLR